MSSQGLLGALSQYWDIEDKPRLHRRNTYFDHELSNVEALRFGLCFIVVAMAIVMSWCILGMVML